MSASIYVRMRVSSGVQNALAGGTSVMTSACASAAVALCVSVLFTSWLGWQWPGWRCNVWTTFFPI